MPPENNLSVKHAATLGGKVNFHLNINILQEDTNQVQH